MTIFSANLGFLFTELRLPDAVRAADKAGFAAVEFHWPYDVPLTQLQSALQDTALPVLSLNTLKGETNGLCARCDLIDQARHSIDEAFAYGAEIGARAVHVMSGIANGEDAQRCLIDNLIYACDLAKTHKMTVLIEALNHHDAPGYFLSHNDHVAEIIAAVGRPELQMMFDCYHVVRSGGDILSEFDRHKAMIGHVQFAGTPDRGHPSYGTTNYKQIFSHLAEQGWNKPIGAEYRPTGATKDSLSWIAEF